MPPVDRMSASADYERLVERLKVLQHYGDALALLEWDQETYMPEGGAAARAELCAALSRIAHTYGVSRETAAIYRGLVDARTGSARGGLKPHERAVVAESYRRFLRTKKLPESHVAEEARVTRLSHSAWTRARSRSDFALARPHLEKIVRLKRRECALIGYDGHPYDALLDDYEPHMRTADVDRIFGELREPLTRLAARLQGARLRYPRPLIRSRPDEAARVRSFCEDVLRDMGFDFNFGRLDESVHPFATSIHPRDVRMTVRKEKSPFDQILAALHEGGHALYDQGRAARQWGTPLADAVSLGIHESQSRLWENQVGRGRPFWTYYFPRLKRAMPRMLARVGLDAFLAEVNRVSFSAIRVEADEVTYGLHVIVRFELEKALVEGTLEVKNLPAAWNAKMEEYLGVRPRNDAQGCLQDVHWFTGNIGYFPTYVLGNLYAAQFFRAWKKERRGWESDLEHGRLTLLTEWLRAKIHRHGSRYTAAELVKRVTGKPLRARYFLDYLEGKYGVAR